MSNKHEFGCSSCNGEHAEIETCGCSDCHDKKEEGKIFPIILTVIGALLIIFSFMPFINEKIGVLMLTAAALVCGISVFIDAAKSLINRKISESVLLVIAVVAAYLLGEYSEAAIVTVLFRIGELMEDYASDKSRKSIEALFSIVSDSANLVMPDGAIKKIDADDVEIGDIVAVLPYETVPVDGIVIGGNGSMDTSALTGESLPVAIKEGSAVSSGMINGNSTVYIRAEKVKEQSYASRIVEMVEDAAKKKGKSQRAITTFAKYYTPAIIIAAIITAVIPSLITDDWQLWIHRSLILLVAACPCAVVLSVPLAFFSSMGAAAKNGMIIKGSCYIESLAKADTVVFDKTGTLTTGELKVGRIYTAEGYSEKKVLSYASMCEYYSTHPIAKAIVNKNGETDVSYVSDFTEIAGGGTTAVIPEGAVLCGGKRLMENNSVDVSDFPNSPVYIALNGKAVGAIGIESEMRTDAPETVKKLRLLGIENSFILTGDSDEQARKACSVCGIDCFKSNLLPEDKLIALEEIKERSEGVIYIGDGINDAPVLAASDIGIAMGMGTQAACEAADIILTNSELVRVADTVNHSKRTMSVLKANVAFAVAVKLVVVILGIIGIAPMWSAIVADVGTLIICVANSSRLMKIK